jgi:hypothetical protein
MNSLENQLKRKWPFHTLEIQEYILGDCDDSLRQKIEALRQENAEFDRWIQSMESSAKYNAPTFEQIMQGVAQSEAKSSQSKRYFLQWGSLAALLVFTFWITLMPTGTDSVTEDYTKLDRRAKGNTGFLLYKNNEVQDSTEAIFVSTGDVLAFHYRSLAEIFVLIMYQMDEGPWQVYISDANSKALQIKPSGSWQHMGYEITLEVTFHTEHIALWYSLEPFDLEDVTAAKHGEHPNSPLNKITFTLHRNP